MAGPDPAIHVFDRFNMWIPGKRPGLMTAFSSTVPSGEFPTIARCIDVTWVV
jgi:hypothetical protein